MAAGSEDAPGDTTPSKDTLTSNNSPTPVDDCMAVESEKEFGFNTKFSFRPDMPILQPTTAATRQAT
jgi:hypothetical protein